VTPRKHEAARKDATKERGRKRERRLGDRGAGCRRSGETRLNGGERGGARLRKVEEVGLGLPELSPGWLEGAIRSRTFAPLAKPSKRRDYVTT